MITFLLAALIFFLAGMIQGLTGFGAGLVAIPLLCLIIEVKEVVPLCILNIVVINAFMVYTLRDFLDKRKILPLVFGAIPGILIGSVFFTSVNERQVSIFLGSLLVLYSVYNLLARPRLLKMPSWSGYFAGFCSGGITALLSTGGPPVIVYTTLRGWEKNVIKSTLNGFFLVNASFTALVQVAGGITSLSTMKYFSVTVPMVLLGTAIGSRFTEKINHRVYLKCIYFFLIFMGILMVVG